MLIGHVIKHFVRPVFEITINYCNNNRQGIRNRIINFAYSILGQLLISLYYQDQPWGTINDGENHPYYQLHRALINDIQRGIDDDKFHDFQLNNIRQYFPNAGLNYKTYQGGRRKKKRTRKRRKSRRKSRRKKRGGISSQLRAALLKKHKTIKKRPIKGSNFFKELVEQEKKIKKLDKNGLFLLKKKVADDNKNLTLEERIHFTEDSEKFMPANTNEKKKNLIYLLATWVVFIEGRKNKIIFFKHNSFPNFLKVLKAHGQVYKESQASARTS